MSSYLEKFEKMRIAGKLAAKTLDMLTENIKEGISTAYIDKLGYEFIRDHGGYSAPQYYRGFKKSLCTSLNHVVCHGMPSKDRILQYGSDWADQVNDKSYGLLSFGFSKKIAIGNSKNIVLANLTIDNLLDKEYISTIGYPEPGRSANFTLEYKI